MPSSTPETEQDPSKKPEPFAANWQAFLMALQLLTRIPVPHLDVTDEAIYGRSVLFYPLVGVLIGVVLVFAAGLSSLLWPTAYLLQAGVILAAWCLVTGGLHIDGLADSADAWMGGFGDRQRTLDLLKDPTCGPIAVMLVVLVLLLKFAALTLLLQQQLWMLVWIPLLGRSAVLALFMTTDYARAGGMGAVLHEHLAIMPARWILGAVAFASLVLFGVNGFWALLFSALTLWGLRALMLRRLGGTTGDTVGAAVELVEVAALLGLLVGMS